MCAKREIPPTLNRQPHGGGLLPPCSACNSTRASCQTKLPCKTYRPVHMHIYMACWTKLALAPPRSAPGRQAHNHRWLMPMHAEGLLRVLQPRCSSLHCTATHRGNNEPTLGHTCPGCPPPARPTARGSSRRTAAAPRGKTRCCSSSSHEVERHVGPRLLWRSARASAGGGGAAAAEPLGHLQALHLPCLKVLLDLHNTRQCAHIDG